LSGYLIYESKFYPTYENKSLAEIGHGGAVDTCDLAFKKFVRGFEWRCCITDLKAT